MPYYRRNLYILSVTVFLASLSWQQVIPFLPKFLGDIGARGQYFPLWVSMIVIAQNVAAIVMQPIWGKIGDSVGRKPMIIRAGICLACVYYAMSLCRAPWQLIACRFLNGALTGFIPGSFALIATNTPEQESPRYVAILESASNVGLIVGPAFGALLVKLVHGYRPSMVVSGTAVLISTLLVVLLVQEPNKVVPKEKTSLFQDFCIAFRSPVLSSLLLVISMAWMFGNSIAPYLVLHLETLNGWRPWWLTGVVYSLPGLAFVISAYRWSCLGQEWGYHRNITIGLVGGSLGALALFLTHNVWAFAGIYFLTGLCLATLSPSVGALTCTRVPEDFRGRAYAIQQAAGTLASIPAAWVCQRIVRTDHYSPVFLFVSGLFLLGAIAFRCMLGRWGKPQDDSGDESAFASELPPLPDEVA